MKIATMILVGVPLSFAAPLLIATLLWAGGLWASMLFALPSLAVRWLWLFLPPAVLIVSLLYYLELRTNSRASKKGAATKPAKAPPIPVQKLAAEETATAPPRTQTSSAGIFEIFVIGSRFVVSAFRQWAAARRLHADRDRAAAIVRQLVSQTSGVDMSRLLIEGEKIADIRPELVYLAFYEWVGIGEKQGRVWLYSAARHVLQS